MDEDLCRAATIGPGPGGFGWEVSRICDSRKRGHTDGHADGYGEWRECPQIACALVLDHPAPCRNRSYDPIASGLAVSSPGRCFVSYSTGSDAFGCIYPNGHVGRHGDGESHWWDREGHLDSISDAPCVELCGDTFPGLAGNQGDRSCELEHEHSQTFHRNGRNIWPGDHRWMSTSGPSPAHDETESCGSTRPGICEDDAEETRAVRDRAVGHAVRALTPLAGAYLNVTDYGADITILADRLAYYIKDGQP